MTFGRPLNVPQETIEAPQTGTFGRSLTVSQPTSFQERKQRTILERQQAAQFGTQQPIGTKLSQLLQGMGNLFQKVSGQLPDVEQTKKQLFGIPGEAPEEREIREKREGAGEFLATPLLPFPKVESKQILESVLNKFKRVRPKDVESLALGAEELPISTYKTAEDILSELKGIEKPAAIEFTPPIRPSRLPTEAKPLQGRVSQSYKDLGIRPTDPKSFPTTRLRFKDQVLDSIHPREFYNSTRAGKAIKNEIASLDKADYKKVNELYETSRELQGGIEQVHPELVTNLSQRLEDLNSIPAPSTVQKSLIRSLEKIIKDLAEVGEGGNIVGYKPMNNQTIIDQIQSLRQILDYDFEHAVPKNIFKPTIRDLQEAATNAARSSNPKAAEAIEKANTAYREWATTYNNDYINPYRDLSNKDFISLFDKATDIDNYNILKSVLEKSKTGKELLNSTKRSIVSKNLKTAFKDPRKAIDTIEPSIRELEEVLTPQESLKLRESFQKYKTPSRLQAKKIERLKEVPREVKAVAKYTNKTPEQIEQLFNSRSGIREIKTDLSKTKRSKELFDKMASQKVRDILRQGKIKPDYTGKDLYKVINKKDNYELLSELLTPEEVDKMLEMSQKISSKKVTKEGVMKLAKFYTKYKFLHIVLGLL